MEETKDVAKLAELNAEKDSLDPSFTHAGRLIDEEINKIKNPSTDSNGNAKPMEYSEKDLVDLFAPKMPKVECYIKVPTKEYPSVNFVGRIIGPGGATLKGIQEVTRTRIAVLGKGSQRDKKKAEEMAESGDPKYAHMKLPLHVRISAVGPPDQAHMGVSRACAEVMKLIHVDEEELQQMNQSANNPMQGGRGRGQRGRGGNTPGRGMNPRGRGGTPQTAPRGSARGSANSRGGRGGSGRGGRGNARGGRGGQNNYQQKGQQQQQMMQSADPYSQGGQDQYASYDGYGNEQYSGYEGYESYADGSYTDQSYGAEGSYGQEGYDMSGQYYGGQQDGGYQSNYSYGNGAGDQGQYQQQQSQQQAPQQQQSKPYRGKMMGGRGQGGNNRGQRSANAKPY